MRALLRRSHAHPPQRLNNSLALASQVVKDPNNRPGRSGWAPSVSIQGKLHHLVGPLQTEPGETRKWAQLYVHDPAAVDEAADDDELQARYATLKWPSGTSGPEKDRVLALLRALQSTLHDENTYVHDFMMAGELFATEGAADVELVISRDCRPTDAHARQYDPPSGGARRTFQEVTVLVGEGQVGKGCVQLRRRGGGAWRIDYNHRAFDPLHFVLLFPHGDDGWHWYMPRAAPAVASVHAFPTSHPRTANCIALATATSRDCTSRSSTASRRRRIRRWPERRKLCRRRGR